MIHPVEDQLGMVERAPADPALAHVMLDISWDETSRYIIATPEGLKATAAMIDTSPDRFLFGSDEVAPTDPAKYYRVFELYAPLFAQLTPEARGKLLEGNYERIFDEARAKVRAWERANVK